MTAAATYTIAYTKITVTATTSYTIPPNVSSLTVKLWGGGGSGAYCFVDGIDEWERRGRRVRGIDPDGQHGPNLCRDNRSGWCSCRGCRLPAGRGNDQCYARLDPTSSLPAGAVEGATPTRETAEAAEAADRMGPRAPWGTARGKCRQRRNRWRRRCGYVPKWRQRWDIGSGGAGGTDSSLAGDGGSGYGGGGAGGVNGGPGDGGGGGGGGNLGTYTVNGNFATPGNSGDPDYVPGCGVGGSGANGYSVCGTAGGNGLAVIYIN